MSKKSGDEYLDDLRKSMPKWVNADQGKGFQPKVDPKKVKTPFKGPKIDPSDMLRMPNGKWRVFLRDETKEIELQPNQWRVISNERC